MHWFWRAVIAVMVGAVVRDTMTSGAIFAIADRGYTWMVAGCFKQPWLIRCDTWQGRLCDAVVFGVPPILAGLVVYGLLGRLGSARIPESQTRCRKCGYILRGISEPRCPECGERI